MASATNTHASTIEDRIKDASTLGTFFTGIHKGRWYDVAVAWEGMPFDPPDGIWFRVSILWGDSFLQTQGSPGGANTLVGVLSFQCFDQPGNGTGRLYDLADVLRDLFNRNTVSGIRFDAPSGPKPATRDEDGWDGVIVDIPFEVDETVT